MSRIWLTHKYRLRLAFAAVVCLFGIATGCALFGNGGGLTHAKGTHVSAPQDWRPTDRDDADQAYRLPSGSIATYTSACRKPTKASLEILTRQLVMGTRDVKIIQQEPVRVSDVDGLHSVVRASIDDVPFHLDLYVFKKNGCIFDFTLMNPSQLSGRDVEEFTAFVKSFRYGTN